MRVVRILFVGDIVGQPGVDLLVGNLSDLRAKHRVDIVVANGENMNLSGPDPHTGFGMLTTQVEVLLGAGVDVITSGNHAWDGPDAAQVLMHSKVLRPINVPERWYGRGMTSVPVGSETVTVVNVTDSSAIPEAYPAFPAFNALEVPAGPVLVDYHGDLTSRKFGFAFAVDGRVSAVLGTHTHEPTLLGHRLPNGTGFVAEVGMTGPLGGVLGSEPEYFVANESGIPHDRLPPAGLARGPVALGSVLLELDGGGKTRHITRIGLHGEQAMTTC